MTAKQKSKHPIFVGNILNRSAWARRDAKKKEEDE